MTKTGGGSGVADERRCRYGFNTIDVVLLSTSLLQLRNTTSE
jgi:hypothetical protein